MFSYSMLSEAKKKKRTVRFESGYKCSKDGTFR